MRSNEKLDNTQTFVKSLKQGRGGGQVVIVLAFNSDDPRTKIKQKEAMVYPLKNRLSDLCIF